MDTVRFSIGKQLGVSVESVQKKKKKRRKKAMEGRICGKGRFKAGSERVRKC